jgi:hypothetical protein
MASSTSSRAARRAGRLAATTPAEMATTAIKPSRATGIVKCPMPELWAALAERRLLVRQTRVQRRTWVTKADVTTMLASWLGLGRGPRVVEARAA